MKHLQSKITYLLTTLIAVQSFIPILPQQLADKALETLKPKTAQAASSPDGFGLSVKDHNCSDQEGSTSTGGGGAYATDANAKDPDCTRILFNAGGVGGTPQSQSIYTTDFRIGTKLAESENGCTAGQGQVQYTPWVS